ncbi:hypothetical protein F5880DRAFT_1589123 [Lentinula raphanica]|nr:hypothetical protein F5880DRAFT_1589123 [Lentinula raphanica]
MPHAHSAHSHTDFPSPVGSCRIEQPLRDQRRSVTTGCHHCPAIIIFAFLASILSLKGVFAAPTAVNRMGLNLSSPSTASGLPELTLPVVRTVEQDLTRSMIPLFLLLPPMLVSVAILAKRVLAVLNRWRGATKSSTLSSRVVRPHTSVDINYQ